ncbi:MAG: AAA family ATPase [Candidatus Aenigmarchaeota archaeon]|nr:AAA family ATPase [Candidatus Aenigmarchaeota archaeon]
MPKASTPKTKKKSSKTEDVEKALEESITTSKVTKTVAKPVKATKPVSKPSSDVRVPTGIEGVDELVNGGLLPGSLTLVTGTTGTGKTIFSSQFLYNGATKYNEKGVYVSFEEPTDNIKEHAKKFGWDFADLEKKGMIKFVRYDPYHIEDVYELIESQIKQLGATRVVIDSISALGLYVRDSPELRRMIFNIALLLRKLKVTTILTSEILPDQKALSRFGVEEFVADGIIVLYYLRTDSQYSRSTTVWKMRGTEHSHKLHPYLIQSGKGIVVYPKEEAFIKM